MAPINQSDMEQSPNIVEQIISNLNQRYGLTVRLGIVEDSRLLPMANKATMTIRCNYRLLLMFQLYHMGNANTIARNKRILQDKDFIEQRGKKFEFVDPIFQLWLSREFMD